MTTTAVNDPVGTVQHGGKANRIVAAFRLQFLVPNTFIVVPLLVFFGTWAAAVGVGALVHAIIDGRDAAAEPVYGGVSQASLFVLLFMAAYTVTHTLPFAMALSFSRRVYVLGVLLTFVVVSAAWALLFIGAAFVEEVTNGFGIYNYQFALPFLLDNGGYLGTGLLAFSAALAVMLIGFLGAALFRRLSLVGFWSVGILAVIGIAVIVVLLGQFVGWGDIGQWFGRQSAFDFAGWLLLASVPIAALSYVVLRRATPN